MLRAALRSLLQHKLRLVLTLLAVVVGVAFVAGTFIFTDSLKRSFDALFTSPLPDLTVTSASNVGQGPGGGGPPASGDAVPTLPASDIARVSSVAGVAQAYGVVNADGAIVIGSDGKVVGQAGSAARGAAWVPDATIYPLSLTSGSAPTGPGQVALLESTATSAGVAVGDTVRLSTPGGDVSPRVVGLVSRGISGSDGGTLVVFDLATAQRLLLQAPDQVTGVVVKAEAGVSQDQVAVAVKKELGTAVQVQTGAQRSQDIADRLQTAFQFINVFLLTFAFIALFVAVFLIFNTFSMLVAQRTRELALLRAVGASRGQVRRSVLAEAAVLGVLAAALGVVGGVLVSLGLRVLLSGFGAQLPSGPLVIEPRTIVVALVVGVLVTVVSAYVPARRAAVVPPVAAMRDEIELPTRSLLVRTIVGAVLLLLAVVTAQRGLVTTDDGTRAAQLVGVSALCALVAVIALAPMIGRGVLRVLGWPFSGTAVGRLARENGRRNPRRTAATASALAIGLALMTAIGVIAASTKASVADVVDTTIGADYIVFGAKFQPFSPKVYDAVKDTPGTSTVTYVRQVPIKVKDSQSALTGVEPAKFTDVVDLTMVSGSLSDLALGEVAVDDKTAAAVGARMGDTITGTFVNGTGKLTVAAIYQEAGAYQGWITSMPTLMSIGARELDTAIYVKAASGADLGSVKTELDRRLAPFPTVTLQDQASIKDQINSQFDRVFGFIYALLALAVIVAFLGIVNTLALSVHERRREVGLLRAVGTSRPQVRRMVVLEAVLISLFGAALGVALGLVYGALLQRVLEPQGVTVLAIPGGQIGWFLALGIVGGLVAALWPAFTASRLDVLRAIASE
ncbi:MAG TPA: FtsX-like permease family protein [Candidatus Nanopelagicales bacterium]|nr:FtsX-like permease family protein [Candidatus Nanopelagicales bacterium]